MDGYFLTRGTKIPSIMERFPYVFVSRMVNGAEAAQASKPGDWGCEQEGNKG